MSRQISMWKTVLWFLPKPFISKEATAVKVVVAIVRMDLKTRRGNSLLF
jgi:hypothetical protein